MQLLPIKIHITLFLRASLASEGELLGQEVGRLLEILWFLIFTFLLKDLKDYSIFLQAN